jgi:hypothetical protein
MKYWGWLLLKLVAAAAVLLAADRTLHSWFRAPVSGLYNHSELFTHDLPYTATMMLFFLFCYGTLHVIIWDQRTRCRTCLRRLRMPVVTGSWSNMLLFGQPRTEYICIFGHGTLKIPEVELTGSKWPNWEKHDDDIWKELESYEKTGR